MKKRPLATIEREITVTLKRDTANVLKIGGLLIEARKQVKHGDWLPWLKKNFPNSERSAQHYMAAADWAAGKSATIAHLKLSPSAVYALAALKGDKKYPLSFQESFGWLAASKPMARQLEADVFKRAKKEWVSGTEVSNMLQARITKERAKAEDKAERAKRLEENRANRKRIKEQRSWGIAEIAEARREEERAHHPYDAKPGDNQLTHDRHEKARERRMPQFLNALGQFEALLEHVLEFGNVHVSPERLEAVAAFLLEVAKMKREVIAKRKSAEAA